MKRSRIWGVLSIRLMGDKEDIEWFLRFLAREFGEIFTAGPYKNKRDPGWRCYVNIRIPKKEEEHGSR